MLGQRRGWKGLGVPLPAAFNASCTASGAARMKNQFLGSYKGFSTCRSKGWVRRNGDYRWL